MQSRLNLKIIGSGPTGLLLSIALSKFDLNIYLTDLLPREKLIEKDKTYAITHSTRKILLKFGIWEKLKPYLFGFDTLSISDSIISTSSVLTIFDLDVELIPANSIGWVVKHSDLLNVFFNEIDKQKNIFFKSHQNLAEEQISFDFKFISTGSGSISKKFLKLFHFNKTYNHSCLTFKVLLRGNVERRAYEIFRKEGPLALLPLENNLYQIIWTASTSKSIYRSKLNKNFLLDNLSTILPSNFIVDQVIGDINVFPVSLNFNFPIFNLDNSVLVGDSFHTFHPVGGQGLNTCWRDVNAIFDIFNKARLTKKINWKCFKYKYYTTRFLDILSTILVTDFLIKVFANNFLFLLPIRKFTFLLLNNISFLKSFVLNHMTKSINYRSIRK